MQGNETRIPSHQLQKHHPVVRFGGGVQFIQRVGGSAHGGIKAEGAFRASNIIIDRLRHAYHRNALFKKFLRDPQGAVAADHDQPVKLEIPDILDQLRGDILDHLLAIAHHLASKGVAAVGRAEDRPAARQNTAHIVRVQRADTILLHEAIKPVLHPQHLQVVIMLGSLHHRADYRVQTGGIAPAGQHSQFFHFHLKIQHENPSSL